MFAAFAKCVSVIVKQVAKSTPDVTFARVEKQLKQLRDGRHQLRQLCSHAPDRDDATNLAAKMDYLEQAAADDVTLDALADCAKGTPSKKKLQILFGSKFTPAYKAWKIVSGWESGDGTDFRRIAGDANETDLAAFVNWVKGKLQQARCLAESILIFLF